ncbi:synaptosomal-associated protein 29 [Chrysoperla carnea]|uniref:synaptosomal-associated protein 29 n=1 Tax=Chrysoperla carnea TaxID=189513 RepID=UPI001D08A363|nr:synaptosomal-associated protein 29 [Chrysoperla carnea]
MSGHKYITDSKNLFSDDDVDDNTFLQNSRQSSNYYSSSNNDPMRQLEDQRMSILERSKQIEESTLRSTQKSIGLLRESEQVGIATAEELQRQREKLELTDKRLDEINSTLRFSQKHLNGIKSVFGSLKNYLSGKQNEQQSTSNLKEQYPQSTSRPTSFAGNNSEDLYKSHPLSRINDLDNDINDVRYSNSSTSGSSNIQAAINSNLEEMLKSTIQLKGLAIDLSEEIDSQNDLIDNITYKTDKADLTIHRQNKEMNKILKKK